MMMIWQTLDFDLECGLCFEGKKEKCNKIKALYVKEYDEIQRDES
jgi:hypothetical protein